MKALLGTIITGKSYGASYASYFATAQFERVFIHRESTAQDSTDELTLIALCKRT